MRERDLDSFATVAPTDPEGDPMSITRSRTRAFLAPLVLGLLGLVAAACVQQSSGTPYYGIIFNAPTVGYIGKTYTPTATATSGLPVSFALDASSTGCSFDGTVISYDSVGTCVINANQPGDETHAASAQVQRTIGVHTCPPLYSGTWSAKASNWAGSMHFTADVGAYPPDYFYGTIDLRQLGGPAAAVFEGNVACEVVSMSINGSTVNGWLSWDGMKLTSSYSGFSIVLTAPANAGQ